MSKLVTKKIIGKSNFDRENISDFLVADNVNPYYAEDIVDFLNNTMDYEYFIEDNDYKLYIFDPNH